MSEADRKGGPPQLEALAPVELPTQCKEGYKCLRKNVAIFQASIAFQGISAVV